MKTILLTSFNITNPWVWMTATAGLLVYIFVLLKRVKKSRIETEEFINQRTKYVINQKNKMEVQKIKLEQEKEKSDALLKNVFPEKVAEILKNKGVIKPIYFEEASILFADIIGFSKVTPHFTADELVETLNLYFKTIDVIRFKNRMILIKTIGDCYFTVGGIPKSNETSSIDAVLTGLQIQEAIAKLKTKHNAKWDVRVGINTGEIVTGVLDTRRPMFDVWGSAVNIASRVQDAGEAGMVNVSEATYRKIYPFFICNERGEIDAKNVGKIKMYFVVKIKPELSENEEGTIPNATFWKYVKTLENATPDYISLTYDILNLLEEKLPKNYYYHSVNHTLNVMRAVEHIGFGEGIYDENILLLKAAALFHDTGFLDRYNDNEEIGVKYAQELLPKYGFTEKQIQLVSKLIMATKADYKPKTVLEKIMKDADLDYLGRDDFPEISEKLKQEFIENKVIENESEFYTKQLKFLKSHTYFTKAAQKRRKAKKKENYKKAKELNNTNA